MSETVCCQMNRDDKELLLKDWEVTKDRIKHFDDVIVRLRLQSIPIALGIMSLGAALYSTVKTIPIPILGGSAGSLLFLAAGLYLIPILALDLVHYKLLLNSVAHAISIENLEPFQGKLEITNKITNNLLTSIHTLIAVALYGAIILLSLSIGYVLRTIPPS